MGFSIYPFSWVSRGKNPSSGTKICKSSMLEICFLLFTGPVLFLLFFQDVYEWNGHLLIHWILFLMPFLSNWLRLHFFPIRIICRYVCPCLWYKIHFIHIFVVPRYTFRVKLNSSVGHGILFILSVLPNFNKSLTQLRQKRMVIFKARRSMIPATGYFRFLGIRLELACKRGYCEISRVHQARSRASIANLVPRAFPQALGSRWAVG